MKSGGGTNGGSGDDDVDADEVEYVGWVDVLEVLEEPGEGVGNGKDPKNELPALEAGDVGEEVDPGRMIVPPPAPTGMGTVETLEPEGAFALLLFWLLRQMK